LQDESWIRYVEFYNINNSQRLITYISRKSCSWDEHNRPKSRKRRRKNETTGGDRQLL
jgi:hypothetical protein